MTNKIAFLVADEGIERIELTSPWDAVKKAGYEPVLVSIAAGTVATFDHLDPAGDEKVDVVVGDAIAEEYAALVLPGGVGNPDKLRMDADAVAFVQEFATSGKPVAAICHAPWTLIEAGVVEGKRLASWPSLKTDLTNAGAEWVDEAVVVDGTFITSRNPDDLPDFNAALLEALQQSAPGF